MRDYRFFHTPVKMSYRNKNHSKPQEIPIMSKDEISSLYEARAQQLNACQIYRQDGSPIVGALYKINTASLKKRKYKGKSINCKMQCCSEKRAPVEQFTMPEQVYYPGDLEDFTLYKDGDWVPVMTRSQRRLKKRIACLNLRQNSQNSVCAIEDD